LKVPEGSFRATFEDKILMSDIVFLRTWYPVKPVKFYNPVTSLLISSSNQWAGMKTVFQLRTEKNLPVPFKSDSYYKPIERPTRRFNPMRISKSLQKALPYVSKPKLDKKKTRLSLLDRRVVILEPQEKKVKRLVHEINAIKNDKLKKKKEGQQKRYAEHLKQKAMEEKKQNERSKITKKRYHKMEGIQDLKRERSAKHQKFSKETDE